MPKPIRYPETTEEQRMQLFNLWETTGDVTSACAKTNVSRATFYYWKDTFIQGGYHALKADLAATAAAPTGIPQSLIDAIRSLKADHPLWGKWQILRVLRATHPYDVHLNIDTIRHVLGETGS